MDRLTRRIADNAGLLVRFEPLLPQYVGGNEISFDGETGVYFGFARYAARCGWDERLTAAWKLRQDTVAANGGRLHPNVEQTVVDQFTFTRDAISHRFGQKTEPHSDRLRVLEQEAALWMAAVVRQGAPCYRLNLAYLHFAAIGALGYHISDAGRWSLCAATEKSGVPTWDFYCGRGGLHEFVDGFQFDQWEMRHQRCAYEGPDGQGVASPALDLIMAHSLLHGL